MTRLIVKGLPKDLTEEKLREHFATKGNVTDAKLMRTQQGKSRRFGFIGYQTEMAAKTALEHFNNTFINTSRITVEKAIPYGSDNLPRAWSKYSEGSSAHDRINGMTATNQPFEVEETDAYLEKKQKKDQHVNMLNTDGSDPKLKEYLDVMALRTKSKTWANDDSTVGQGSSDKQMANDINTSSHTTALLPENPDDDLYDDLPAKIAIDEKTEINASSEKSFTVRDEAVVKSEETQKDPKELIRDTGRLFVRNLAYTCTEKDLKEAFSQGGQLSLSEIHMPIARDTKRPKGYAYILYMIPEDAVKAYSDLDMTTLHGRLLHILPAEEKPQSKEEETKQSSIKKEKEKKRKNLAGNDFNWNSLYMSSDAVAGSIADRLGIAKSDILNADADNMAVRLALAETQIVTETKDFFESHGIVLDAFGKKERSDAVILVKNFPFGTTEEEIRGLFRRYGELGRVLIPPARTIAIVEFLEPAEGRVAFKSLAYRRFKDSLIYLEKAPEGMFKAKFDSARRDTDKPTTKAAITGTDLIERDTTDAGDADTSTLFVKNLNFATTAESLQTAFSGTKGYRSSRIIIKPGGKSMGYGFIEFSNKDCAHKVLEAMQGHNLDGHAIELKFSDHQGDSKTMSSVKPETSKLIVRNVPFEATSKDLRELFGTYGQLKSLRLPKKFDGGHRGFAFLDFITKQEAKTVYENMANIHLYGRHLVLEWAKEEQGIESLREQTGKRFAKEQALGGRLQKKSKVDLDEEDMEE